MGSRPSSVVVFKCITGSLALTGKPQGATKKEGSNYKRKQTLNFLRGVFSNKGQASTPQGQPRATSIHIVLEITWIALSKHSKGGFSCHVQSGFASLWFFGGIVNLSSLTSFKVYRYKYT